MSENITDKNNPESKSHFHLKEGSFIFLGALCVYLFVALGSYTPADPAWSTTGSGDVKNAMGASGAWLADVFYSFFGYTSFLLPILVSYRVWMLFRERQISLVNPGWLLTKFIGLVLVFIGACGLFAINQVSGENLPAGAGGILGQSIAGFGESALNINGTRILLVALFLFGITVFTGLSWLGTMDKIGALTLNFIARTKLWWSERKERKEAAKQVAEKKKEREVVIKEHVALVKERKPVAIAKPKKADVGEKIEREKQVSMFTEPVVGEVPNLALLNVPGEDHKKGYSEEALEAMSRLLELKLADFNVQATVQAVYPGPVITRFEIQPAAGTKASKITGLAKDLARSLAVISVRVVEVIPGKSVVGIEIPNEDRESVLLSQVLTSKVYEDAKSPLTMALGHDISGLPIITDLAKMPHLLVAGTTGSGKSVGVNAMLISLLYKSTPEDLRLLLVDPKMLELSVYEDIPHLLTPVITDMKDAANGLRWCVGEMERRYKLMAAVGVRNVAGLNRKIKEGASIGEPLLDPLWQPDPNASLFADEQEQTAPPLERLPYIVVVIDEFADMMMIVGKKVEELIARIAQKARAAGIHLILATQRPSVDVITGLIKANVPTRIAFQVSSKVDSRTILDQGGAEQLLGMGDMLYLPPGTGLPIRVHGAFVDDDEVHRVAHDWKMRAKPQYIEDMLEESASEPVPGYDSETGSGGVDDPESDNLYDEAVAIVTETRKASISYVQRRLRIGYNRAARLIETMEAAGVVSGVNERGQREVLAPEPPK